MNSLGTVKLLVAVVAAVGGTAAFMIACGSGPSNASAAATPTPTCTQWQVAEVNMNTTCPSPNGSTDTNPCDLPAGWVPLGTYSNPVVLIGRCKL